MSSREYTSLRASREARLFPALRPFDASTRLTLTPRTHPAQRSRAHFASQLEMRIQPSIFHRFLTEPVVRGLPCRQLATTAQQHANSNTTVNVDEIAHFSKLSALWWDERGEFQMLHRMNPTRIRFVREKLVSRFTESLPVPGLSYTKQGRL